MYIDICIDIGLTEGRGKWYDGCMKNNKEI